MFILQKLSCLKIKKLFLPCNLLCVSISFLADATHPLGTPRPAGAGLQQLRQVLLLFLKRGGSHIKGHSTK